MTNPVYIHQYNDGSVVPASKLDRVLATKGTSFNVKYYSFLNGDELTDQNRKQFYLDVKDNILNKRYPTTDHLFVRLTVGNYEFLYVSLDNSVRANQNGFSLKNRLAELCRSVTKFIKNCGGEAVIYFSESCRPSFDGGMNERAGEIKWSTIIAFIADACNLKYLSEYPNNDTSNGMAFGPSVFCTFGLVNKIKYILPTRILTEGIGSATLGVRMDDDTLVWGVHFPIDFKGKGDDNLGAKAMKGLVKLISETHPGSIAFGDMNTIHGEIENSIVNSVPDSMTLYGDNITFLGAYYDTVSTKEDWQPLL